MTNCLPYSSLWHGPMCRSRKCCQRGSNTDFSFDAKYQYIWAIIGLPAKHHLTGISRACRWWPNIECWLGSFVIFKGSGPVLLRNTIFLWFNRGIWTPVPPLDPPMGPYAYIGLSYIINVIGKLCFINIDGTVHSSEVMGIFGSLRYVVEQFVQLFQWKINSNYVFRRGT